ncbi:hypothetical protein [Limnoglobus roseus]|uniref:Uncharacterized protein n=1 Tax=Limnoglobus roseus TaxID=2598579 RepID=A0A5C1AJA6_9BACT|nr:hypothetical protein [Limnoglobus roseus]QEL18755.1 hypothetical protein PX52LOC_05792 [Limnoglobus roseus]
MNAQERALQKLRIAIEQRDWEIAKEAHGILDGTLNAKQPWEAPKPFAHPYAGLRTV